MEKNKKACRAETIVSVMAVRAAWDDGIELHSGHLGIGGNQAFFWVPVPAVQNPSAASNLAAVCFHLCELFGTPHVMPKIIPPISVHSGNRKKNLRRCKKYMRKISSFSERMKS